MEDGDITTLLSEWAGGSASALDSLAPLVLPELRELAIGFFRRERAGHTLQPTALINELFIRLVARRRPNFENRRHFYALSARLMRFALVDHARSADADKRGNRSLHIPLNDDLPWLNAAGSDVIDLDRALTELAKLDAGQVEMLEMRYLAGCTVEETAEMLGVSPSTVDRKVRLARAWLFQNLRGDKIISRPPPARV